MEFLLCVTGYGLFFLYDWHSVRPVRPVFGSFFALGCVCLAAGTALAVWNGRAGLIPLQAGDLLALGLGLMSLAGLVYTLFFALPFSDTYVRPSAGRRAYTEGIYALCRHPGVLWLGAAYLCLAAALGTGRGWAFFAVVFGLDLGYVLLQDRWTFPQSFCNYEEYRQTTPFLWPTIKSLRRCARTLRGGN